MQHVTGFAIPTSSDASGNVTGVILSTSQWVSASFMAYFSEATAAGTIQLQYSDDNPMGQPDADFTPTNWANVPGSTATATITSGGTGTVYVPNGFVQRWLRVVFTRSGGAGTFAVTFNALFV